MDAKTVPLQNEACTAIFDRVGGALVDFRLQPAGINPLNFCWQEGAKEKSNVVFKGHFLCLGRWGDPSPGEASKGHIKHGHFNQLEWQVETNGLCAIFSAHSTLECLSIKRSVELDASAPVMHIKETVQNTHTVGRLFNMVQHPTLAAPFLNEDTIVDCNATTGFDYAFDDYNGSVFSTWPEVSTYNGSSINLRKPARAYSSVFSFIVNKAEEWGWITAYSPTHKTVLGYVWKRDDYPWITQWLHYKGNTIQYRGLEFGTTGIHKPFKTIWEKRLLNVLGEPTCRFIDAGEKQQQAYIAFLLAAPAGFTGVQQVRVEGNAITIEEKETGKNINILHHLKISHEFSE